MAGPAVSDSYSTCTGQTVVSPDGDCSAYYYRARNENATVTQVLVECRSAWGGKAGGNVVAYHDGPDTGIALRWLSDDELEVALDPQAPVVPGPTNRYESKRYFGHQIRFTYRELNASEPEWTGCALTPDDP